MAQPRSFSPSSSSPSPTKRPFKTNQNVAALQHKNSVRQTQTLDVLPVAPKNAAKRQLKRKGDDHLGSKRHKTELSDSKISELKNHMQESRVKGNAPKGHAKPKGLMQCSQSLPVEAVSTNERIISVKPSPNKPVKKIRAGTIGTQTQVFATTTVAVQTNTDGNGSTHRKSYIDVHHEILHEKFQMLMKQFEMYTLKRFEDRGIPAEEMNQHVSSLLEAFKLADSEASLMTHVWNFVEAIEGTRNNQKFLLDKCKETISSEKVLKFVKTHMPSWEDDQWGRLSHAVNTPWSYADPAALAIPPVIFKQERADNSPLNQPDCNFEKFDDDTMFAHDLIPAVHIKEERMDGIVIDYQHGSTTLSFNSM